LARPPLHGGAASPNLLLSASAGMSRGWMEVAPESVGSGEEAFRVPADVGYAEVTGTSQNPQTLMNSASKSNSVTGNR
jgi:hypothetical protein